MKREYKIKCKGCGVNFDFFKKDIKIMLSETLRYVIHDCGLEGHLKDHCKSEVIQCPICDAFIVIRDLPDEIRVY